MAGLFKKLKQDYTLNPNKGSNKATDFVKGLADWKQVGEDLNKAGKIAEDAAVYGSTALISPLSVPVAMATGQSIPGLLGYKSQSKLGEIGSDVYAKGQQLGGGLAVGYMGGGNMGLANTFNKQKQNDMYKFGSGGLNTHKTVINVEKGELLADPKTGEIIEHYNDVPKHPKGEHEIDLRGNVEAPVGYAVIPANMANDYKAASAEQRLKMIQTLPGFSGEKLGVGTDAIGAVTEVADKGNNMPVLGATALGAVVPMGYGLYQSIAANRALKKLAKDPYQQYNEQVQPELQTAYSGALGRSADASLRARYGLSQEQKAAYAQNVSRDINTRMQRAQDLSGGNLGAAVGNVMNANHIQAYQQQAALDAQRQAEKQMYADRMAQYADSLAQRIASARMSQQNANVGFQNQLKLQKERAYGLAKQQGMQNVMNAPMSAASVLATYYGGK